jgi:hypothetical protein
VYVEHDDEEEEKARIKKRSFRRSIHKSITRNMRMSGEEKTGEGMGRNEEEYGISMRSTRRMRSSINTIIFYHLASKNFDVTI